MSVDYRTRFIKTNDKGEEKYLDVSLKRAFGEILDEIGRTGTRKEPRRLGDHQYEACISIYRFSDLDDVLQDLKAKRRKYEGEKLEKRLNLYQVRDVSLYDRLRAEIQHADEMVESIDEKISYIEYIINGVSFHFLQVENCWNTDDITFEVEVC